MVPPFVVAVLAIASLASGVAAQTSEAVCTPERTQPWTNNSKGQSPCLVTAFLRAVCNQSGNSNTPALEEGKHYIRGATNECTCSTVLYDLTSECGLCQGRTIIKWSEWFENCTEAQTSIARWPNTIPAGTAIPAWAFYDPRGKDTFNRLDAAALASRPDTFPPSNPANNTPASTTPSTNIGAIVGGVVGGLVIICATIFAVIFVRRRQNQKRTQRLAAMQVPGKGGAYGMYPHYPAATPYYPPSFVTTTASPAPSFGRSTVPPGYHPVPTGTGYSGAGEI